MENTDDRYRRAMATRARMDEAAWRGLCLRHQAGEPIAAVAASAGVHPGSIRKWQAKLGLRLKDDPRSVPPMKGPAPVVLSVTPDGAGEARCGEVVFTTPFDPDEPGAAARGLFHEAGRLVNLGEMLNAGVLLKLAELVLRVSLGIERADDRRRAKRQAEREARMAEREARRRRLLIERGEDVRGLTLRPAQTPPGGDWRTWLFLGGRGAGKTLAGASWLADQAERLGEGGRLALVGPTLHDVREVMIEGASGVRNLPRWTEADRPVFEPSRRRVRFSNGCMAYAFSAEDPDSLRGPQFAGAWADEFCAWPRGEETLALLRMGLRLGEAPRLMVSTTPRPTKALIRLRDEASCVQTHAATAENAAHLADGFVEGLRALYGGTRREAQELEGRVVDLDGALFTAEMMALARIPSPLAGEGGSRSETDGGGSAPESSPIEALTGPPSERLRRPPSPEMGEGRFERVVVAIDPTATLGGDACGIVAAGVRRRTDGVREAVVLADRSARGLSPDGWARRALALAEEVGAGAIVAEVNQGGDMVAQVLKAAGCALKVKEVRATRGKRIRAEPVAALYEQGRVRHAQAFGPLEEELMAMGGAEEGSLDRADALVWAITDLMIDGPDGLFGPRIRAL